MDDKLFYGGPQETVELIIKLLLRNKIPSGRRTLRGVIKVRYKIIADLYPARRVSARRQIIPRNDTAESNLSRWQVSDRKRRPDEDR